MKTGLEAVRFGIVLYTLPYLFVYSPALLFDGSLTQTFLVFIQAAVGVFALAVGAQGFFLNALSWPKRGIFVGASILLFWPSHLLSLLGIAILVIMVALEWRLRPAARPLKTESSRVL